MKKIKYCAVIEFFLEDVNIKQIHEQIMCKDNSSSLVAVYNWIGKFKRGRTSFEDDLDISKGRVGYILNEELKMKR